MLTRLQPQVHSDEFAQIGSAAYKHGRTWSLQPVIMFHLHRPHRSSHSEFSVTPELLCKPTLGLASACCSSSVYTVPAQ